MFGDKKVALVATGGGGRSIAHAGVIQACRDFGIELSLTIGASAGALATVLYGQYLDTDKILDHFRPKGKTKYGLAPFGWGTMVTSKKFFNSNIKNGFFDLSYAERFFKKNLLTDNFNEVPIKTYVTATNLDTRSGVLFGPGINDNVPISKALVASCCIPVMFRPVEINNEYYIDGEIRRPVAAIETVIHLGADVVIVSDTYNRSIANIAKSGMLNIASEVFNMLLEDKSLKALGTYQEKYPHKLIIPIQPQIYDFSSFDTKNYEKLYEAGYKAASIKLAEILK